MRQVGHLPEVNDYFCRVSYYAGGLIIVFKCHQATWCIKECISFTSRYIRDVGNAGTHFLTNFHENLWNGKTPSHIYISRFMKICTWAQELWKHANEYEDNKSLLGFRKQIIVKYVLGNWLQTCQLIWSYVTFTIGSDAGGCWTIIR